MLLILMKKKSIAVLEFRAIDSEKQIKINLKQNLNFYFHPPPNALYKFTSASRRERFSVANSNSL